MTTIDFEELTWRSTSLLCNRAYQITNGKTYVFAYSVLRLGKMGDDPIEAWKNKIKWYSENNHMKGHESNRRHADRVETIPRNHNVGPPREDSKSNEKPTV